MNTDDEREKALLAEFAAQDLRIDGFTFRRWAACDLITALELGLLISNPVELVKLSAGDRLREFGKLAYLVSLSPEEGEALAGEPEKFNAGAREFMRKLSGPAFGVVMQWLDKRLTGQAAATVDVEPKPAQGGAGPEPKKN